MKDFFEPFIQNGINASLSEEQTRNIKLTNTLIIVLALLDLPFLFIFKNEPLATFLTSLPLFTHLITFFLIKNSHFKTGRFILSLTVTISVFFIAGMVYIDDGTEGMAAKFLMFGSLVIPFLIFKANEWKLILAAVIVNFLCITFFDYYNTELALKVAHGVNFDTPILRLFSIITAFTMFTTAFLYYKTELGKYYENLRKILNKTQEQKKVIELQQQKTLYDIEYAQTIQEAILPIHGEMNAFFEHFIIYRAQEVVSGDFFWFKKLSDTTSLIVVADCTGHGVPGAFMSLIASRILDEIVVQKEVTQVDEILNQLKAEIRLGLKQDFNNNTDGLDICLCKLSKQENEETKCEFSGAKRPLIIFSAIENQIKVIKGDRIQIGGKKRNDKKFSTKEIILQKNDMLYLSSDGYIDQAPQGKKKIGSLNFQKLLKEVGKESLNEQQQKLEYFLEQHLEGHSQRDDITVIGIKM